MQKVLLTVCLLLTAATTSFAQGALDRWGEAGLIKKFFMEYLVKVIHEGPSIKTIVLSRKGHHSGNAWFHGGECYALVLQLARGPGKPIDFDQDITVDNPKGDNPAWIDKVTGNKAIGDESLDVWRFEALDSSGAPILTAHLDNGSEFVFSEVIKP